MVQVGNAQIAPGAVTTTKIATGAVSSTDVSQSFMKQVHIFDNLAGNAIGWNPDGVKTVFTIDPAPGVDGTTDNYISVTAGISGGSLPSNCDMRWQGTFTEFLAIICDHPPLEGVDLFYQSVHLPTESPS
jgi:hypothetical protein